MSRYDVISILYNPVSTGPSKKLASQLQKELKRLLPRQTVNLIATKHAGHAEELAYKLSLTSKRPLIVSSSGDGTYNEVLNGCLKAQAEDAQPCLGLLPAGNANDHYESVHHGNLAELIVDDKQYRLDVLEINCETGVGASWQRYAHSYIGLGLTPQAGKRLTEAKLNPVNQILIALGSFFKLHSVRLKVRSRSAEYDHVVFSNVQTMSRVITLDDKAKVDDGKFELTIFPAQNRFRLFWNLLRSIAGQPTSSRRVESFQFTTVHKTAVQLDGEVFSLAAGSRVRIECRQKALRYVF